MSLKQLASGRMLAVQHEAIDLACAYDRLVEILEPLEDVCYRLELSVHSVKSLGFDLIVKLLPASQAKLNDDSRLIGSDVGGSIVHTLVVTLVLFKGRMYFFAHVIFIFFPSLILVYSPPPLFLYVSHIFFPFSFFFFFTTINM